MTTEHMPEQKKKINTKLQDKRKKYRKASATPTTARMAHISFPTGLASTHALLYILVSIVILSILKILHIFLYLQIRYLFWKWLFLVVVVDASAVTVTVVIVVVVALLFCRSGH